jgi:hypothetical protein
MLQLQAEKILMEKMMAIGVRAIKRQIEKLVMVNAVLATLMGGVAPGAGLAPTEAPVLIGESMPIGGLALVGGVVLVGGVALVRWLAGGPASGGAVTPLPTGFFRRLEVTRGLVRLRTEATVNHLATRYWVHNSLAILHGEIDGHNDNHCRELVFEPSSRLHTIDDLAFHGSGIRCIHIPASITSIGAGCFEDCTGLCSVTFEARNAPVDKSAEQLETDNSAEQLKIAKAAFRNCCLWIIELPYNVWVGANAFTLNSNHCAIILHNVRSVTGLADVFERPGGTYLEDVVEKKDELGCSGFGARCFAASPYLAVSFASDCEILVLSAAAFVRSGLTGIKIPRSVIVVNSDCFSQCKSLRDVTFEEDSNLRVIADRAFWKTALDTIKIPKTVQLIAWQCFEGCPYLASVTFENNSKLKHIYISAFWNCHSLKSIVLPKGLLAMCLFEIMYHISWWPKSLPVIIFESDCELKHMAGFDRSDIKSIEIPKRVTTLDARCFDNSELTSVTFRNKSRLQSIGSRAFADTAILEIAIPASVTTLNFGCFSGCKSLASVTFNNRSRLQSIGMRAFSNTAISMIAIPENVTVLGEACFFGCISLTSVIFENRSHLQVIGPRAFAKSAIRSIKIPASVTILDEECFLGCKSLASVTFKNNSHLQVIGRRAFAGSVIPEIVIPASVSAFGDECFYGYEQIPIITFKGKEREKEISPGPKNSWKYRILRSIGAVRRCTLR